MSAQSRDYSPEERTQFVTERVLAYEKVEFGDIHLWTDFHDDFHDWDEQHFKAVKYRILNKLRGLLYRRGVQIDKKASLATALCTTLQTNACSEYVSKKISEYENGEEEDDELWARFKEDFGSWDSRHYSKVSQSIHNHLFTIIVSVLYQRGVYVERNPQVTPYPIALAKTAAETEPHVWTNEDMDKAILAGPIHSKRLSLRNQMLNPGLT